MKSIDFRYLISLSLLICTLSLSAQNHVNVSLLSNTTMGETSADIWGYTDSSGLEYAVIGTRNCFRIYSLEDPTSPLIRDTIPGTSTQWRDMKSFGDYIYGVQDQAGSDGLLIVDMSLAPDTITHTFWTPTLTVGAETDELAIVHNMYIDEDGYGYLSGSDLGAQGVIIIDLFTTPGTPTHIGEADLDYSHDVYVRDSVMYTSEIHKGYFAVYDVRDRTNPIQLATKSTGRMFTHNTWLSDDANTLFTTDERSSAYIESYDISNLGNIQMLDRYRPLATVGTGVIPHNVHVLNDFLVVSYYTDGVIIIDAAQPDNLIEVGNYDTKIGGGTGFQGCWGAFPFLPSGILLASDITTGLYVLQPDYIRACYLRGEVRDVNTLSTIPGVNISIVSTQLNLSETDNFGKYATGIVDAGNYQVIYSHPSYTSDTVVANLQNGVTTTSNIFLGEYTGPCVTNKIVTGTVSSRADFASQTIESNAHIQAGVFVDFHATDLISLDTSFQVDLGGQLNIDNDGCN